MPISEISEQLKEIGYDIPFYKIKIIIRDAKVDMTEREKNRAKIIYIDSIQEMFRSLERLKDADSLLNIKTEKDVRKKVDALVKIQMLIQKAIRDIGEMSGEVMKQEPKVENNQITVYNINQTIQMTLVKYADEGKITLHDPELKFIYERWKKEKGNYDGQQHAIEATCGNP